MLKLSEAKSQRTKKAISHQLESDFSSIMAKKLKDLKKEEARIIDLFEKIFN